jgi:hypothetical protein
MLMLWLGVPAALAQAACKFEGCSGCQLCLCPIVAQGYITTEVGCRPCLYSCALCGSESACSTCNPGFFLKGGLCEACPNRCRECGDSTGSVVCSGCQPGYYLLSEQCYECPYQYSLTCLNSVITACQEGYYLASSGAQCLPCVISDCLLCDQTACTRCRAGFYRVGTSACSPCFTKCLACSSSVACTSCAAGFSLSNFGRVCLDCSTLSAQCATCSSACTSCRYPSALSSGQCQTSTLSIPRCLTTDGSGCLTCQPSFYLEQQSCLPCSALCLTCLAGHFGRCSACTSRATFITGRCIPLAYLSDGAVKVTFLAARNSASFFTPNNLLYCLESGVKATATNQVYKLSVQLN